MGWTKDRGWVPDDAVEAIVGEITADCGMGCGIDLDAAAGKIRKLLVDTVRAAQKTSPYMSPLAIIDKIPFEKSGRKK